MYFLPCTNSTETKQQVHKLLLQLCDANIFLYNGYVNNKVKLHVGLLLTLYIIKLKITKEKVTVKLYFS